MFILHFISTDSKNHEPDMFPEINPEKTTKDESTGTEDIFQACCIYFSFTTCQNI